MTAELIGRHRFEDGWPICKRCGSSRSAAALGLESPFPSRCVPYATTFRYWRSGKFPRSVTGLRMAVSASAQLNHVPARPNAEAQSD